MKVSVLFLWNEFDIGSEKVDIELSDKDLEFLLGDTLRYYMDSKGKF